MEVGNTFIFLLKHIANMYWNTERNLYPQSNIYNIRNNANYYVNSLHSSEMDVKVNEVTNWNSWGQTNCILPTDKCEHGP